MSTMIDKKPALDVGDGWRLLAEGEPLKEGDGFMHPDCGAMWIDYACRPDLFRGAGKEGSWYHASKREYAHTWPWRRRVNDLVRTIDAD